MDTDTKIDRNAFAVVTLDQADDDVTYWLERTPQERLQGIESTRQVLYGYSTSSAGLQRVFEVAELTPG